MTESSHGQVRWGSRPKKGEVRWQEHYFGSPPQAWYKERAPLTTQLLAAATSQSTDSLALVMLPDYRIQFPSRKQYIRVYLLNPTARKATIKRADATVMGLQIVVRLDDQWMLPQYLPQFYCGNSLWQDTLASKSYMAINLDGDNFYQGTVPVECMVVARVGQSVVKSPVFTALLTPLQLYFLRYPRVPYPDIN